MRKSLFTSIPLPTGSRLHWEFYSRTLLLNDHNLQTTLWTSSTTACLTSTYFQYNGKNYKKVARYSYGLSRFCYCSRNCDAKHRGTSPSYLYANCTSLVKLRWRHFYICTTVNTDEIDDFHEHGTLLDRRRTYSYQGIEENGKIPFLDCLVTLHNNRLRTTIYRKPTHQQVTGPVIIQLCGLSQLYGLHGLSPDERN